MVALHTLLGLGLMAGPLFAAWTIERWLSFPLSLLVVCAALAIAVAVTSFPDANTAMRSARLQQEEKTQEELDAPPAPQRSAMFWLFMAIAVLYAFAEGTFRVGWRSTCSRQDTCRKPPPRLRYRRSGARWSRAVCSYR
ncbi:MAG: hypothetical protein H0V78_10530 [Burkholderiales bacterium]|nr:hypothetical protein [Burkholderiales bacterium]